MSQHKVVIIGSGPAGHTAALYCARASLNPLILEGFQPGGQLTTTTIIENFPGFPEGVDGTELMDNFRKQSQRFGAKYENKNITKIDFSKRPFHLISDDEEYFAETVIIATGASPKFLGLKNEQELVSRGVSTCATCDGFFFKDKIVHIVGGGDSAIEEAVFLTKFVKELHLIHRREELRASKIMQERALKNKKIQFLWNSKIDELLFDDQGLTGLKIQDLKTGEITNRKTDGLFLAIGHKPNTGFLGKSLTLDNQGYIVTKAPHPDTNIPGVFACGDVQDHYYRQAISAAGSGCEAAIRAEKFLESQTD